MLPRHASLLNKMAEEIALIETGILLGTSERSLLRLGLLCFSHFKGLLDLSGNEPICRLQGSPCRRGKEDNPCFTWKLIWYINLAYGVSTVCQFLHVDIVVDVYLEDWEWSFYPVLAMSQEASSYVQCFKKCHLTFRISL